MRIVNSKIKDVSYLAIDIVALTVLCFLGVLQRIRLLVKLICSHLQLAADIVEQHEFGFSRCDLPFRRRKLLQQSFVLVFNFISFHFVFVSDICYRT